MSSSASFLVPPERSLVFVIDAFDESGDTQSRPDILRALTDAAAQTPWLKNIITSRPEDDILRFFDALPYSSHERYDLGRQLRFLDFVYADDCSENGWRTGQPGHDRGNGEGFDRGDR